MVGPGDVDDELEPEVKDECNTKYGDVITVVIHEIPKVVPEETVRIFVEFKRMESAIKAVVDLNGRFFGGRQVRAGFYNQERFDSMDLDGWVDTVVSDVSEGYHELWVYLINFSVAISWAKS